MEDEFLGRKMSKGTVPSERSESNEWRWLHDMQVDDLMGGDE